MSARILWASTRMKHLLCLPLLVCCMHVAREGVTCLHISWPFWLKEFGLQAMGLQTLSSKFHTEIMVVPPSTL